MTYDQAIAWTKANKERIQNDALGGDVKARAVVDIHRLLVARREHVAEALFVEAVAGYRREVEDD